MTTQDMKNEKLAARMSEALRKARLNAGMTQADVAERADLLVEIYARIERGGLLPSVPTLRRLCQALRVDPSELLALERQEDPQNPET